MKFDTEKSLLPWLVYSFLALLILGPALHSGFVFALDMVFTPTIAYPVDTQNHNFLFFYFLHYLNFLLPSEIIQKIILFLMLTLLGTGAHYLARYFLKGITKNPYPAFFAGIFSIFNPFVYERLAVGHYSLLLGLSLLPFFIVAISKYFKDQTLKNLAIFIALSFLISIVSIHTIGLAGLIFIVFALTQFAQKKNKQLFLTLKHSTLAIFVLFAINSNWLIPYIFESNTTAQLINFFDENHRTAFATNGGILNVLQLKGFWLENRNIFVSATRFLPLWIACISLIGLLIFLGIFYAIKKQKIIAFSFAVLLLASTILALGTIDPIVGKFNLWLLDVLPLLQGYREPQKFAGIILISYCYFGAWGNLWLIELLEKKVKQFSLKIISNLIIALPLFLMPIMFWGLTNQLQAKQYPADWHETNEKLNNDKTDFRVLFLPWHQYLQFKFADKIIANPAEKFFNKPILSSQNPEYAGLQPQTLNPNLLYLENIFTNLKSKNLATGLKKMQVKYILIAKEVDYVKYYNFLESEKNIKLTHETENLYFFTVN